MSDTNHRQDARDMYNNGGIKEFCGDILDTEGLLNEMCFEYETLMIKQEQMNPVIKLTAEAYAVLSTWCIYERSRTLNLLEKEQEEKWNKYLRKSME